MPKIITKPPLAFEIYNYGFNKVESIEAPL